MTSKPNTHHGAPVDEWFEEEEARDPGFLARIDVQIATDDALLRARAPSARRPSKKRMGMHALRGRRQRRR